MPFRKPDTHVVYNRLEIYKSVDYKFELIFAYFAGVDWSARLLGYHDLRHDLLRVQAYLHRFSCPGLAVGQMLCTQPWQVPRVA